MTKIEIEFRKEYLNDECICGREKVCGKIAADMRHNGAHQGVRSYCFSHYTARECIVCRARNRNSHGLSPDFIGRRCCCNVVVVVFRRALSHSRDLCFPLTSATSHYSAC